MKRFLVLVLSSFVSHGVMMCQEVCEIAKIPDAAQTIVRVAKKNERTLIFFIRFSDFGCELCLNDFLDFCDSLRVQSAGTRGNVGLIFERDKTNESDQITTLRNWARANGIPFPIRLLSKEAFGAMRVSHSVVALLSGHGDVEVCGLIPVSMELKRLMIDRLNRPKGNQ